MKNFAILYDEVEGDAHLAPVYDLVTTTAYLPQDRMALTMDGSNLWPTAKGLLQFGERRSLATRATFLGIFERIGDALGDTAMDLVAYASEHPEFAEIGRRMIEQWDLGRRESLALHSKYAHSRRQSMVRYGLLGFGHHCEKRLVPAFPAARKASLAGLWRRNIDKGKANARDYSIEFAFDTAEAMCASPAIDAIFVASPDAMHLPDVLLALRHGKPVLCEKPLGMSAAEVEQMLAASKKAGTLLGVAQNMRYNTSLDVMRSWIGTGRIGRPVLANAQFCYAAETSPRQWIYDPALACGGPIGDVGIHCIDALRYVLDSRVAAVNTLARADARSAPLEAVAAMGLDFTEGAMGTVTVCTRGAYRSMIELTGETGTISCQYGLTVDTDVDVVLWRAGRAEESVTVSNADCYTRMLDAFADWVEGSGDFRATAADGLHNQRVLDAAYASWRTGERQALPAQ